MQNNVYTSWTRLPSLLTLEQPAALFRLYDWTHNSCSLLFVTLCGFFKYLS